MTTQGVWHPSLLGTLGLVWLILGVRNSCMSDAQGTVVIVDDDADMRESLACLLRSVGIATRTYASADKFLSTDQPDESGCLVCDVRVPQVSGLDLVEQLRTAGCQIPVIFMSAHADVPMVIRAMKMGAAEFLEKPFNAQVMLGQIQRALLDDSRRRAEAAEWNAFARRMAELSDKERETLTMILEGVPNKTMAARLEISERGVEMRRASLMKKLQARSLAELIRLVTQHELQGRGPGMSVAGRVEN